MRFTWSLLALLGMPSLMMAQSYFIKGPEVPKPSEKTAIQEMTDYLARRIGDKTLSIGGKTPVTFQIGDTELARQQNCLSTELEDERWVIRSVGDQILMMENAIYSVISPEGCAGILWRDGAKAPEAAEALKITAPDLLKLGAIDEVVKEPAGGAQKNHKAAASAVKKAILAALKALKKIPVDELIEKRYEKIRAYGNFYS